MNALWLHAADAWAAIWLDSLVRASWQGGLFILAVWGLCRLCPRLPAAVRSWLWWLACLKMVVGLACATPITLRLLPAARAPQVISAASSSATYIAAPRYAESEVALPSQRLRQRSPVPEVTPASTTHISAPARPTAAIVLLILWAVVVVVRGTASVRQIWAARRLAYGATPIEDPVVVTEATSLGAALGLRRIPPLRESLQAMGPLVVGLPRPVVLLPPHPADRLSVTELRMALAHELAHVRRGDLWLALLPALAQTLFFFHPLVWWAGRECAVTREEACDVEALRATGADVGEYGLMLFKFASARSTTSITGAAALGAAFSYLNLERRLKMLQQFSPTARRRSALALSLLLVPAVACILPWRVAAQEVQTPVVPPHPPAAVAGQAVPRPGAPASPASSISPASADKHVTLRLKRMSLQAALDRLFRAVGIEYRWDSTASTIRREAKHEVGPIEFTDFPLSQALDMLLQADRPSIKPLTYDVRNGVYVIIPDPVAAIPTPIATQARPGEQLTTPAPPALALPTGTTTPFGAPRAGQAPAAPSPSVASPAGGAPGQSTQPSPSGAIAAPLPMRLPRAGQASVTSSPPGAVATPTPIGLPRAGEAPVAPPAGTSPTPVAPFAGRAHRVRDTPSASDAGAGQPGSPGSAGSTRSAGGASGVFADPVSAIPAPSRRIRSLEYQGADLRSALKRLFDQTQTDYVLALGSLDSSQVTTVVKDVPLEEALTRVLAVAGANPTLTGTVEHNIYIVLPSNSPHTPENSDETYVTLKMEAVGLHDALEALFASVHASYTIDRSIKEIGTVTASLNHIPFHVALENLLHQSDTPLTYRMENGVYQVTTRSR